MQVPMLAALLFAFVAHATNTTCYWKAGSTVVQQPSSKWYVCNSTAVTAQGASSCCYVGSECGQDGFCHFVDASPPGKAWFIGGCTDQSWDNPTCHNSCTQYDNTYAQYNATDNLWSCCGEDVCNGSVTSETFSAIAPNQFSAVSSIATAAPNSASSAPPAATTSTTAPGHHHHHLSPGAIAGTVVACVVGGLAILGLILFALVKQRRKRRNQQTAQNGTSELMGDAGPMRQQSGTTTTSESDSRMLSEVDSSMIYEADSKVLRQGSGHAWPLTQQGGELMDEKTEMAMAELPEAAEKD